MQQGWIDEREWMSVLGVSRSTKLHGRKPACAQGSRLFAAGGSIIALTDALVRESYTGRQCVTWHNPDSREISNGAERSDRYLLSTAIWIIFRNLTGLPSSMAGL
jgi:hypothetical protein